MCCSCPFFRMDSSSALRIAVRVPAYVEACDDGRNVQHSASDFQLILDRDTMNLKELTEDVAQKLSYGKKSGLQSVILRQAHQMLTNLTTDAAIPICSA